MSQSARANTNNQGFTLAELLIATMLISIVMSAAYVSFSAGIRMWRDSSSDIQVYQDARIALGVLESDLRHAMPLAGAFMEGSEDTLEFIALTPLMQSEEGTGPRIVHIRYSVQTGSKQRGSVLVREESVVESPIPVPTEDQRKDAFAFYSDARAALEMGDENEFEICPGIESLQFEYEWTKPALAQAAGATLQAPVPTPPVVLTRHEVGRGMPKAIRVRMTLQNPDKVRDDVALTSIVVFPGPTGDFEEKMLLDAEGGLL